MVALGKRLGVKQIASGNVGQLGDSYIINLKLIDVETQAEIRRISQPLRGDQNELIEAVRVAAYRLVAPDQLKGSVAILSDVPGAMILLDDRPVGRTPLPKPISFLDLGTHKLQLTAEGYSPFTGAVEIRFQKTSEVVVRMIAAANGGGIGTNKVTKPPWYTTKWA